MPFTQPTFAEAKTALASRLNDPDFVRWGDPELGVYIIEALRTWNAWTAHFRDQSSFQTTMNEPFYDLPTEISTLRGYTVTNWDLVADLQYALLEPAAPGGTWTGTDQFTLAQLSTAIQRRRDQFLRETGAVLTRSETADTPPASGRLSLDESVLNVRRAAWRVTSTGILYPLLVSDEWASTNYQPTWGQSTGAPRYYSVTDTPPLELQLMPPGGQLAGTLDLVSINKGAAIDETLSTTLDIPDDFAWVVKFGALADLLNGDGLALDPSRAQYCELRWQQGIEQARRAPVTLTAQISDTTQSPAVDVPVRIGALSDADRYTPTWQLVAGVPKSVLLSGGNLLALTPPPGGLGGPWTVTLDVVRNAPVPDDDADVLQISADVYDSILDYAQHLALFKEGPGQTDLSLALLERAARAAGITLRLQQASQPTRGPLIGQQQQDRRSVAEQRLVILEPVEAD